MVPYLTRPLVVVDVTGEWQSEGKQFDDVGCLMQALAEAYEGEREAEMFVLRCRDKSKANELFQQLRETRAPATVVCDEAHVFAGGQSASQDFIQMILMGRHDRQSVVAITQRPQRIVEDVIDAASISCFRQQGRAAQKLAGTAEGDAFIRGCVASDLGDLERGEFVQGGFWPDTAPIMAEVPSNDGSVYKYNDSTGEIDKIREV